MDSQVAKRRINTIAAHFATNEDISPASPLLLPMNCSSGLNSCTSRRDNRIYFARQSSDSQACFMRQVSTDQVSLEQNRSNFTSIPRRRDNQMYFARQSSDSQPCFMRQVSTGQDTCPRLSVPSKSSGYSYGGSYNGVDSPLFSRISSLELSAPKVVSDCKSPAPTPDSPKYARPAGGINEEVQFYSSHKVSALKYDKLEWSPRMDVAELGGQYVVTVELPGITVSNIKVMLDDHKLIVMGNRTTHSRNMSATPDETFSVYHQNKIIKGSYQIQWPLPVNASRDSVSAEYVDGILHINIPKV